MNLDFSNDVNEIINSEIGEDAILVTASPAETKTLRVVFHKDHTLEDDNETAYSVYDFWADCKASDVVNAQQNDTLTVGGAQYTIQYPELSETGWTILRLTK